MMDLQTIQAESRRAAARSCKEGKLPFILETQDIAALKAGDLSPFKGFPFLGTRRPFGWRRVNLETWFPGEYARSRARVYPGDNAGAGAFFVDACGWGDDGREAALSPKRLWEFLRPGFGYAIVEAGQFQVKIGVFERRPGPATKPRKRSAAAGQ